MKTLTSSIGKNSAVSSALALCVLRIFGPPAAFFIDSQGIVRDVVVGPMTPGRASDAIRKVGVAW